MRRLSCDGKLSYCYKVLAMETPVEKLHKCLLGESFPMSVTRHIKNMLSFIFINLLLNLYIDDVLWYSSIIITCVFLLL